MTTKPRFNIFSFVIDIVIDLALIAVGVGLYFVNSLGVIGINPLVAQIFGNQKLAVLIIAGLLFFVGLFSLLKTIFRLFKR
jgi:hypothetical protein